jgi:outer membrane protein TolC
MHRLLALTLILCLPQLSASAETLSFEEAEKAMLAANPQAAAAALDLEAANARVTAARAGFFPVFSAGASYSRLGSQGLPAGDAYSYGFSGALPLYSPAVPAALRSAKAAAWASRAARDKAASALRYQLKAAFAEILNARETLVLSGETLKRRGENLELIRLKYQAGRENKAALLETEAALKTAQWQHERYRKNLRLFERKLNRLLGRPAQEPVPALSMPRPPEPPEDFFTFTQKLDSHNALSSARARLAAAAASVDSSRSAILPDASASGSYKWSGSDWPVAPSKWALGASLNLPLFAGGKLTSNLASAQSSLRSAEADLKNARDEVFLNAEDAFLSWREARAYMDVAKSSLDAAQARAWLVRKQYLAGQTSYFEWRNVEEQLISEQNQSLAADRGLIVSHAAFVQALGE